MKFLENYFPVTKRNIKRKEFIELLQGNMKVKENTAKFEHLSQFGNNLIEKSKVKNQQYYQGQILPL